MSVTEWALNNYCYQHIHSIPIKRKTILLKIKAILKQDQQRDLVAENVTDAIGEITNTISACNILPEYRILKFFLQ